MAPATFRALGFCGADDSVHPNMLAILSKAYPLVEFGVLFRPDKEGLPRYATESWVERLAEVAKKNAEMKLAAHLCGKRVNNFLQGQGDFLAKLQHWGFGRVQINATAVNGVDTSNLAGSVPKVINLMNNFGMLEFIIQKNDETRPLWEGLIQAGLPKNVSMLVDESKGTGVTASSWPAPPSEYEIGYAGGIGPGNIHKVIEDVSQVAAARSIWIDMESSLRSIKNDKDVFDLDKCYEVIDAVCKAGVMAHPDYIR